MGVRRCYGMLYTHPTTAGLQMPYTPHLNSKSLPDQTFDDAVAIAIGRTSGSSPALLCASDAVVG